MYVKNASRPTVTDVLLNELAEVMPSPGFATTREENSLIVEHTIFTTRVDILDPPDQDPEEEPILAVAQVRTALPEGLGELFEGRAMTARINALATLGAIIVEGDDAYVGSRLTIFQREEAWHLHLLLLALSIVSGKDSLWAAVHDEAGRPPAKHPESVWEEGDFEQVRSFLSRMCVCTSGGRGLAAEFGLRRGAGSAVMGDHRTALWELRTDWPHPELGGGLSCVLRMPHRIPDEARLDGVLSQLNRMEMAPLPSPPHFGAWCRYGHNGNPAYVSFLPNGLHATPGIALNMSVWGHARALWADAALASMGIRA